MKRRASRTAIWLSALALPVMLATGCSKDPDNATATFSLRTEPTEVTMQLGETKDASTLTASYTMEGTHDAQVALRYVSTNRGVATLSLVRYVEPTVHSSDEVEPKQGAGDHTELAARLATEITLSAQDLEAASEVLSCGQGAHGITLCGDGAGSITTGSYLVFAGVMHGSIPLADDSAYQYAVVLDADGNAANNYQADPAYPNDFFQDSDLWLQAGYSPSDGWLGTVTDASGGNPTEMMGSAARLILTDDLLVAVVPASELSQSQPSYRLTAFRHSGAWGFDGDWDGDVEPPVADGLASF